MVTQKIKEAVDLNLGLHALKLLTSPPHVYAVSVEKVMVTQ